MSVCGKYGSDLSVAPDETRPRKVIASTRRATGPVQSLSPLRRDLKGVLDENSHVQAAEIERRDRLIVGHLHIVTAIASGMRRNLPSHVELGDLVQAGTLGLIDAACKYDPQKGLEFMSYARHRIRGAIMDGLRYFDPASRTLRQQHKEIAAVRRELSASLNREPSETEMADRMGVDLVHFRSIMIDVRNVINIFESTNGEECVNFELACKTESRPDTITERARVRAALLDAIATLPERYQEVVILYDFDELPMSMIAKKLRVDQSRVSQIHRAALERMGIFLRAKGINSTRLFLM